MASIPLSDAKAHLSQIADDVHRTHDRVNVTRNGRDYVVIMAADDLSSLEATLELLLDREAQRRIEESAAAVARGEEVPLADMDDVMRARRASDE